MAGAALLGLSSRPPAAAAQTTAPERVDAGRFTVVAYPSDATLARSLLRAAQANDTFPGLPRPREHVLIAIAPDQRRFREWVGPGAPEWGAAIAFPGERRIVMQGKDAPADAGDPIAVLRHELAHLALTEHLGDLPPRWFDEGYASYAAGEWTRDEVLATNVFLLLSGIPPLDSLDDAFAGGSVRAEGAYALSYRAVAELAALDPDRGLTLFFRYWKETRSFERAVRAAYGITATAFESRWRSRTLRRYGGLAVFADVTVGGLVFAAILIPLYISRRRRDRRRYEAMLEADAAAERRARESALEVMLGERTDE